MDPNAAPIGLLAVQIYVGNQLTTDAKEEIVGIPEATLTVGAYGP